MTPATPSPLRPPEARQIAAIAREITGITLCETRTDFLTGRLGRRLAACGIGDYAEYCRILRTDRAERLAFAEALTTGRTAGRPGQQRRHDAGGRGRGDDP